MFKRTEALALSHQQRRLTIQQPPRSVCSTVHLQLQVPDARTLQNTVVTRTLSDTLIHSEMLPVVTLTAEAPRRTISKVSSLRVQGLASQLQMAASRRTASPVKPSTWCCSFCTTPPASNTCCTCHTTLCPPPQSPSHDSSLTLRCCGNNGRTRGFGPLPPPPAQE